MTYNDYIDLLEWAEDHIRKARHTSEANGNKHAYEEIGEAMKRLTEAGLALSEPFEAEEK